MRNQLYLIILFILSTSFESLAQSSDTAIQKSDTSVQKNTSNVDSITKSTIGKFEVKGIIKDKKTGEPVPFATVYFPNSPVGAPADLDGLFTLTFDAYPSDTIKVDAVGYASQIQIIDTAAGSAGGITIMMETSSSSLKEVVITAHPQDPAIELLKKIIARKKYNDPDRFNNYGYEAYTKLELDLIHLSKKEFERIPIPYIKNFSYLYNNLDTSGSIPFLPFLLTETISEYYYQQQPYKTKEFVKATQIKGFENNTITASASKYLGNTFLKINPYDNYILFFYKKYVSPISNAGPTFYKYKITDTERIDDYDVYTMHFKPLRYGENCFEGDMKIVDSFYAIEYLSADVPKEANLNWINNASFYKEYSILGDTLWFCTKENLTVELAATGDMIKLPAIIARRTNYYKDIAINSNYTTKIINNKKNKLDLIVADSASKFTEDYWENARHDTLSKNEHAIYNMLDTLNQDRNFVKFKNVAKFIVTGVYKRGPIELGPYWSVYSKNAVEGTRLQFSMGTTPKLSKDFYFNGYIAYGTLDKTVKYNANGLYLLNKEFPDPYFAASYTSDLDRTVNIYDIITFNNFFNSLVRKDGIPQKFMFTSDFRFEYFKEHYSGFSYLLSFLHKEYDPYAPLPDVNIFTDATGDPSSILTQTEVNIRLRYAYKERFLNGNYYRTSLGSKYPIPELRYSYGLKGVWNSNYSYQRLSFQVSNDVRIAPLGSFYFNLFAGKCWGTLPYPLLEILPGNETHYYNAPVFNMMNQYEFISDQYAGFRFEHSLGGGIFNYIPFIKRLKLRQFYTAKGIIGSLSDSNTALNFNKGYTFRTLAGNPYVEVGTGIENIFRLLRVDFVWRVTPKKLPAEPQNKYFGIFGSIKFNF